MTTEHLISLGREKIGMIASMAYKNSQIRRVQGYRQALQHYGRIPDDGLIIGSKPTLQSGYDAMQQLLEQDSEVTAVFAYNDLIGLGAIRACRDLDKRVPEDIAIIGFDDIGMAAMSVPSLSSIRVDKYAMGQQAMERLLDMLEDPDAVYETIYMDVELVPHESIEYSGF
jgi:LacI family transcriptional regulator